MNTRYAHFIDDADLFDHEFFGISQVEAAALDPQQRLVLQSVWRALEDAAIDPRALAGTDAGVFVGMMLSEWGALNLLDFPGAYVAARDRRRTLDRRDTGYPAPQPHRAECQRGHRLLVVPDGRAPRMPGPGLRRHRPRRRVGREHPADPRTVDLLHPGPDYPRRTAPVNRSAPTPTASAAARVSAPWCCGGSKTRSPTASPSIRSSSAVPPIRRQERGITAPNRWAQSQGDAGALDRAGACAGRWSRSSKPMARYDVGRHDRGERARRPASLRPQRAMPPRLDQGQHRAHRRGGGHRVADQDQPRLVAEDASHPCGSRGQSGLAAGAAGPRASHRDNRPGRRHEHRRSVRSASAAATCTSS